LQGLGVSIDGPPPVHDRIRAMPGCYDSALSALVRAKAAGLRTSANTVVGAPNFRLLPDVMDRIIGAGATHWQVQLAVAMGNAALVQPALQPYQILELMPPSRGCTRRGDERASR
jgi:MoaA/NifB/PqqE/SkfB family radical SAM enzyme